MSTDSHLNLNPTSGKLSRFAKIHQQLETIRNNQASSQNINVGFLKKIESSRYIAENDYQTKEDF